MKKHTYTTNSRRGVFALVLAAMLALFSGSAWAGDIVGRVINQSTGGSLPGASVRVVEAGRSTSTDRGGSYVIANVPAGTYTVEVDFVGFDTVSETVSVPTSGTVVQTFNMGSDVVELDEFRIEGMREGRALALQQKKTSANLRDIISADSVGNLPDKNVADALTRIPGVSIQLSQGEGRFVSIRGVDPDLNNVTVNGSAISNPGDEGRNGRSVPLDVIGSSQISTIEVIKAATPDMDAQGLGGTVNLITPSAFDREKGFFYGSIEGGINNFAEEPEYSLSMTYGNLFGPEKKLAVTFSSSYSWRPYDVDYILGRYSLDVDTSGRGDVGVINVPNLIELRPERGNRQRIGANAKIEYRPNEDTSIYTSFLYSEFTDWWRHVENIFNMNPNSSAAFYTSPTTGVMPLSGWEGRQSRRKKEQVIFNWSIGGSKTWGNLTIEPKFTYSYAKEEDLYEIFTQFQANRYRRDDVQNQLTWRDTDLIPEGLPDGFNSANDPESDDGDPLPVAFDSSTYYYTFDFLGDYIHDPSRLGMRRTRFDDSLVDDNAIAPELNVKWDMDNFFGTGNEGFLKFGFKYTSRDRVIDDNSLRPQQRGLLLSEIENGTDPNQIVMGVYDTGVEQNWETIIQDYFGVGLTADQYIDKGFRVDYVESASNNVEDDYIITEDIFALYGMFETKVGEKLTITGGARYEKTDSDLSAFQFTEADGDFTGDSDCVDGGDGFCIAQLFNKSSYDVFLPNIQFRYEFSDNLVLRGSYTKTIGRPNFEDAAPISTGEWEEVTVYVDPEDPGAGSEVVYNLGVEVKNKDLIAYESDNFDISLEYYMKSGGLLSVAFFRKNIDNPIYEFSDEIRCAGYYDNTPNPTPSDVSGCITVADAVDAAAEVAGSPFAPVGLDPSAHVYQLSLDSTLNGTSGEITGVEFAVQLPFSFLPDPLSGFGVDANYTLMDSSVEVPTRPGEDLPFFRQPDYIGNVALWYQRGKITARLAYRFQDHGLREINNIDTDVYNRARTQLDAQASYQVNDNWTVYGSINNITEEAEDRITGINRGLELLDESTAFGWTARFGLRFNY